MDYNKFFQSKTFKIILGGVGVIIILLLVFELGKIVGFKKANFSYRWGENYHQNFGGPREGFFKDFSGRDFIGAHGVFGQIMKIDGSTLVIKGQDDVEKIVLVNDKTVIERFRETVKITDLKVDDYIVVIGEPNDAGQIEAKFIRIMPSPSPTSSPNSSVPPLLKTPFKPFPSGMRW